jgi:hypothetical protein
MGSRQLQLHYLLEEGDTNETCVDMGSKRLFQMRPEFYPAVN